MARITVEDCIDKFESRFELVLVASNRARKLHSGESPTIEKDNDKNTVIALREIADESIEIETMKNNLVEEYQTVSALTDEDLSLEYDDNEQINDEESNEEKIIDDSADQGEIDNNSEENQLETEADQKKEDNISENIEEESI